MGEEEEVRGEEVQEEEELIESGSKSCLNVTRTLFLVPLIRKPPPPALPLLLLLLLLVFSFPHHWLEMLPPHSLVSAERRRVDECDWSVLQIKARLIA